MNSAVNMKSFILKSLSVFVLLGLLGGVPSEAFAALNLVNNGDFESVDPVSSSTPQFWTAGFSATSTASTYTYPALGEASAKGVRIDIDNATYSAGDAKWVFQDVPVDAGKSYVYNESFKSNVSSRILVRYNKGNCPTLETDCGYDELGIVAPTTAWTTFEALFTVPSSTISITIFHRLTGTPASLDANSTLELDNVSLIEDMEATVVDRVPNNSLEQKVGGMNLPKAWQTAKFGTSTATFDYIKNDGFEGNRSVKVSVSDYVSGDAKWLYTPQPVTGGNDYHFSARYKVDSVDTVPHVVAQFIDTNGAISFHGLAYPEPTSTEWELYEDNFSVPLNVVSVSVYFYLAGNGSVQTDDYHITPYSYAGFDDALVTITFDDGAEENILTALPVLNGHNFKSTQCYTSGAIESATPASEVIAQKDRVMAFYNSGHEICAHSVSHPIFTTLTPTQRDFELTHSREYLESLLLERTGQSVQVDNFATPFGEYNSSVITAIKDVYSSHRTVNEGYNSRDNLDIYRLKVQNIDRTTTLAEFQGWVNKAKQDKLWLILVYHRVTGLNTLQEFDTTTEIFTAQMNWLAAQGIAIKRYDDALSSILTPPVVTPPSCASDQVLEGNVCVVKKKSSSGGSSSSSKKKTTKIAVVKKATTTVTTGTILGASTSILASASFFIFTLPLSYGSFGNEVTELQKRLTYLGVYSGPVTGYFGPLTRAGVIAFQAKNGIFQAGIVGPLTRAALNK